MWSYLPSITQRIYEWLRNNADKHRLPGLAKLAEAARTSFAKLVQGHVDPPKKNLPDYLAYEHLYYNKKLKPLVEADYKRIEEDVTIKDKPARVTHRNQMSMSLYKNESAEVKAEVEAYRISPKPSVDQYLLEDEHDLDEEEKARRSEARQAQA